MSSLSRRGFFRSWLVGLLAVWLGRSPAQATSWSNPAAPAIPLSVSIFPAPNDALWTCSASGLPAGVRIDASTGMISGTIGPQRI